jgi:GAF domain-containing protein
VSSRSPPETHRHHSAEVKNMATNHDDTPIDESGHSAEREHAPPDGLDGLDGSHLRGSLDRLSTLVLGAGQDGLESMLRHVAQFAVRAIPGADGAGLTLLENDRGDTIVATDDFVRDVDAIQYSIGEGPCITAAATGRTVHSPSLGTDPAWPSFGPKVSQLGVHSALSLPLIGSERVLGAMNVYSRTPNAFDTRSVELGEMFAIPAAISVQNAQILAQAARLTSKLQAAIASRATIDQALGILMGRTGCSATEAFDRLRQLSQSQNRKIAVTAHSLVEEAVRRARARSGAGGH